MLKINKRVKDPKEEVEHNLRETDQMYHRGLTLATSLDRFYQYDKLYHQDQMIFQYHRLENKYKHVDK